MNRAFTRPAALAAGLCLFLLALSACAPLQHRQLAGLERTLPARVELTDTPFFAQQIHHCGPAALAMALNHTGAETTPEQLAPMVYTPGREGSLAAEMPAAVRRHGRLAYRLEPRFEALLRELAAGRAVIVLQNLGLNWYPRWHYAVAVGYDLERRNVILRSGERRRYVVDFSTFEHTWRRGDYWALLVLEPGEVPATADPLTHLEALGDLERQGFERRAGAGYRNAVRQWPENVAAWTALGNNHYRLGETGKAEDAYRRALALDADYAPAHNNLAQVLLEQGNLTEAETHARIAVERGGAHARIYRETLEAVLIRPGQSRNQPGTTEYTERTE